MAGAYCKFCDRRCFVDRVLPDGSWSGHMATCPAGMAHDRAVTGYDQTTAINPHAPAINPAPGSVPEPDSCRYCDAPQRMHCQRYVLGVGWHGYVAPTDAQRLARMLARRNARSAA